jgi:predicted molibdopterin-dependent oxidoreductase YjgC
LDSGDIILLLLPWVTGLFFESICESCGECVERCPTGALVRKKYEMPEREVKSVCSYCGVGCGIYLGVRGDTVVRVRGDKESPVNQGNLCVKGRFGFQFINHPDRLKTPLIRKNGRLEETTWDEVLDLVVSKMRDIKGKPARYSPSNFCH